MRRTMDVIAVAPAVFVATKSPAIVAVLNSLVASTTDTSVAPEEKVPAMLPEVSSDENVKLPVNPLLKFK